MKITHKHIWYLTNGTPSQKNYCCFNGNCQAVCTKKEKVKEYARQIADHPAEYRQRRFITG